MRELDVPKVSCTIVPVGGGAGVTEGGLNVHVDFVGSPEQVNAKVRLEPDAPKIVRGTITLCPSVTFVAVTGPNPTMI
jgi:hypothetical protein